MPSKLQPSSQILFPFRIIKFKFRFQKILIRCIIGPIQIWNCSTYSFYVQIRHMLEHVIAPTTVLYLLYIGVVVMVKGHIDCV